MKKANELCKKLREDAGLSIKELADLIGAPESNLCRIEGGKMTVSNEIAQKYVNVFGERHRKTLMEHLVKYDCGGRVKELLSSRGITQTRFAKSFGMSERTIVHFLNRDRRPNGVLMRGLYPEEVPVLARYFKVDPSFFEVGQYYSASGARSVSTMFRDQVKIVESAPNGPKPKKTAQMICEEEKKMEYEEALKKAKDFDILKEENDHLKKDCDEWSMMYNAARGRIDELEKDNERYKKSLDEVYTEIKEYKNIAKERDKAVEAYDNLSNLYGSLSKEAREKDALINALGRINRDLKKEVDSVDYSLASDYKTVSAELAKYKDILLEILLEQRNAK